MSVKFVFRLILQNESQSKQRRLIVALFSGLQAGENVTPIDRLFFFIEWITFFFTDWRRLNLVILY